MGNDDGRERIDCESHELHGRFPRAFARTHQGWHAREAAEALALEQLRMDAAAAKRAIKDHNAARRQKKNAKKASSDTKGSNNKKANNKKQPGSAKNKK